MRDIIACIIIEKFKAERNMTISRDIQIKDDLLAVRPEILVVAMLKLDRFRIRAIVFAKKQGLTSDYQFPIFAAPATTEKLERIDKSERAILSFEF